MKLLSAIGVLLVSLGVSGCAPVSVTTDYDTHFDFSILHTYRWLAIPDDFPVNDIVVARITYAVDRQMQLKGFEQDAASPDFLVSLQGYTDVVRQGIATGTVYSGYSGYREYRRYGSYEGNYDFNPFEEGTLTLTIFNAGRNTLIWEGSVTTLLQPERSTAYKVQKTEEMIAKLLADFPPG